MPVREEDLRDGEVEALGTAGFFCRTQFLGDTQAHALRDQLQAKVKAGSLTAAHVRRGVDRALDTALRGDFTTWLMQEDVPELHAAFRALGEALSGQAYLGLTRFDLQLAYYPGTGSRYVRHRDAFQGAESRRVTAIWYANPGWHASHGGALRLHTQAGPVDVAPVLDRLVVFMSETLEHEVLPTRAPRLAVTAWFYAR